MQTEYEIRFLNVDLESFKLKLNQVSAELVKKRLLLKRQTFDLPIGLLGGDEKKWIRVRSEGSENTITLKHIIDKTRIDGVREIETKVGEFDKTCELLLSIGMLPGPYQENYRETWTINHCQVTIDEWPGLDPFIEVEGITEEEVIKVCSILGFSVEQGKFGSIDQVYSMEYNITAEEFNKISRLDFDNYKKVLPN